MKKILFGILDVFCFISENLSIIGCAALIAIMLLTVADVVLRMFGSTVIGNVEMISYSICVVVFLGFGKSVFIDSFTKVEVFDFRKAEPFVKVLMDIIHMVICGLTSYYCFAQSSVARTMGTSSLMLHIPRWPFLFLAGVGFLLITISVPLSNYKNRMNKNAEKKRALEEQEGTA